MIFLHVAPDSINNMYRHGNMVLHGYLRRDINVLVVLWVQ